MTATTTNPAEQQLRTAVEQLALVYPQYNGHFDGWRFGVTADTIRLKGGDVEPLTPCLVSESRLGLYFVEVTIVVLDDVLIARQIGGLRTSLVAVGEAAEAALEAK